MNTSSCVGVGCRISDTSVKAAGAATSEDMVAINQMALKTLSAKDVSVYTLQIANDQVDRDGERFTLDALHDFADTLPGKGLLEAHEWGPVGLGMFIKSWVEQDITSGAAWLMGKCYLLTADPEAAAMIRRIDGGIAKWVSIGFKCPGQYEVTRPDRTTYTELDRGPHGEPCEALECSLVFLGAQYDAAVIKSLGAATQHRLAHAANGWKSFMLPHELR